ncbi:hypothetical protein [Parasitella parasitica]|uniref:C3H1-type domain-containing protein n=1 Tax=Parasitella parasitica TaxID=35722 RepID=A0A0B7MUI7_9FUNG|nr:hypothetical protein [Parasitella parasitica]
MAICKFFASGSCRNGNSCTFEHISPQNKWGHSTGNAQAAATSKYNETSLKQNLTDERPQWKLSVYGPAKEEPNLIVGVDRSVEEDRLLYYTSMRATGNTSQYLSSYEQLFNQVEKQINAITSNPSGAIQHYEKEKSNHSGPFGGAVNKSSFAPFTNTGGAFGSAIATTPAFGGVNAFGGGGGGGAFGQTSAFGAAKPSAFGASAFGSTSTLGSNSAFGSTSALGGGSAFGSTSALGGGSAFGSTSALGSGSAFGSTSALGGGGGAAAFGKPSAFGAAAAQPSAFGQTSTFGSTSALGSGSAFGSTSALGGGSAFGASTPTPTFGSTSGLGSTTASTATFGSTSSLGGGTFGQPSAFGTTTMGAFGTPVSATPTAFGTAAALSNTNNIPNNMNTGTEVSTAKQSDLEAFQAPQFAYRGIPEIEPPIQLR